MKHGAGIAFAILGYLSASACDSAIKWASGTYPVAEELALAALFSLIPMAVATMAAHGARRLLDMVENAKAVVAIELLAAAQGCDFHAPLTSSPALEAVRVLTREAVPYLDVDRYFHPDMAAAIALVRSGAVVAAAGMALPGIAP